MKRVVLESPVLGRQVRKVDGAPAFNGVVQNIRDALALLMVAADKSKGCVSMAIVVHVDGEGCDHE